MSIAEMPTHVGTPSAVAAAAGPTRMRYVMLFFILLATVISYVDRTNLGIAAPFIGKELGLDKAWADVLVLTCVGGPQTRNLIPTRELEALGPRGILVNVARGSVVDEPALVAALRAGTIGGAGLDVYADEPHVPEDLHGMPNVVLLPHIASGTVETRLAMEQLVFDNLDALVAKGTLVTPIAG